MLSFLHSRPVIQNGARSNTQLSFTGSSRSPTNLLSSVQLKNSFSQHSTVPRLLQLNGTCLRERWHQFPPPVSLTPSTNEHLNRILKEMNKYRIQIRFTYSHRVFCTPQKFTVLHFRSILICQYNNMLTASVTCEHKFYQIDIDGYHQFVCSDHRNEMRLAHSWCYTVECCLRWTQETRFVSTKKTTYMQTISTILKDSNQTCVDVNYP